MPRQQGPPTAGSPRQQGPDGRALPAGRSRAVARPARTDQPTLTAGATRPPAPLSARGRHEPVAAPADTEDDVVPEGRVVVVVGEDVDPPDALDRLPPLEQLPTRVGW